MVLSRTASVNFSIFLPLWPKRGAACIWAAHNMRSPAILPAATLTAVFITIPPMKINKSALCRCIMKIWTAKHCSRILFFALSRSVCRIDRAKKMLRKNCGASFVSCNIILYLSSNTCRPYPCPNRLPPKHRR